MEKDQECPHCKHINSKDALFCELCGWVLATEGTTLTVSSGSTSNSNQIIDITLAGQREGTDDDTLLVDATPPEYSGPNRRSNSLENDATAHFKINKVLGQGGMGAVYRAKDLTLHRNVALKLFRSHSSGISDKGRQLLDEARMACKLNHPNIVTIYDIARGQNSNFIVMEWVDGQSLDKLIPKNGFAVEKALEYACQIIDGLACAHQHDIIHRDVKPQNIMVNKENRIKILDFGIAELLRHQSGSTADKKSAAIQTDEQELTRLPGIVGTPHYMAPEQILGEAIDQRTDIFSFGILLYQLVTGQRPFSGSNFNELKEAILKGDYLPIQQLKPKLPASLIALVVKTLATDRSQRWQFSTELAVEIHKIHETLTARKNWWQRRHWLSKFALISPLVILLSLSVSEVIFPPSTEELIERQLLEATKIAILPFENTSGDPLLQIFIDALIVTLSSDIAAAGRYQGDGTTWVIPSSEIRRMKEPNFQDVSDKFGLDLILTGSVQHMGSTRSLVLNLLDGKDGRQLKTKSFSIDANELFQGTQYIRRQALGLLGWKYPKELSEIFLAKKPQFDGAYKEYIEGVGHLYRHDLKGNIDTALKSFLRAIEIDPEYQQAFVGLTKSQIRKFIASTERAWLDKAHKTIKQLSKINPLHSEINFLSADASITRGNYFDAVELYRSSIESNPNHIESYFGLANAYEKLDELDLAESTYKMAIRLSPYNNTGLVFLGLHYYNKGSFEKAIHIFKRLSIDAPNNRYAYVNMAIIYFAQGEIDEAIKNTHIAIGINPSATSYSNLGTMYFYKKDYDNAVKSYEKIIELKSKKYTHWGNLADGYRFSGRGNSAMAFETAAELAREAVELNSKNYRAIAKLAYFEANLGNVEYRSGKLCCCHGFRNIEGIRCGVSTSQTRHRQKVSCRRYQAKSFAR